MSILEIKDKWSYNKMHEKFKKILDEKLPKFAGRITLSLPKIKKPSEI